MKNWLQKMEDKLRYWMRGRYGVDELTNALSVAGLVLMLLSCIPRLWGIYAAAVAVLVLSVVRCCSKNIAARQKERAWYLRQQRRVKSWLSLWTNRWRDRRTHRYYRCPQCGHVLRVPRGKGKIRITCPGCRAGFEKVT